MKSAILRVSLFPVFMAMLLAWSPAATAADAAGLFQVVVGDIRLIGSNGQERAAGKGGNVYEGDRIITADGALAQIRFADGGLMSVRANSEFVLDKFSYAGPQDAKPSIFMSLVRGGLRSITGLIGQKNRDGYKISTSTATIGIRGTDHEPMVILQPPPGMKAVDLPGTYDKVNDGRTFLQTPKGIVEILPRQVGFVPSADVAPRLLPKVPDFYRFDPPKQGAATPGKTGDQAADKSDDGKATARTLVPQTRALTTDRANLLQDAAVLSPAISTDKTLVAPTTTINTETRLLSPTTTISPTTSTIQSPTTTISPTTTKTLTSPLIGR